jgi:hypothetical protein
LVAHVHAQWLTTTLIQIVHNLLLNVMQNYCPNIETIVMPPYIWIFVNVGNTYFHYTGTTFGGFRQAAIIPLPK